MSDCMMADWILCQWVLCKHIVFLHHFTSFFSFILHLFNYVPVASTYPPTVCWEKCSCPHFIHCFAHNTYIKFDCHAEPFNWTSNMNYVRVFFVCCSTTIVLPFERIDRSSFIFPHHQSCLSCSYETTNCLVATNKIQFNDNWNKDIFLSVLKFDFIIFLFIRIHFRNKFMI